MKERPAETREIIPAPDGRTVVADLTPQDLPQLIVQVRTGVADPPAIMSRAAYSDYLQALKDAYELKHHQDMEWTEMTHRHEMARVEQRQKQWLARAKLLMPFTLSLAGLGVGTYLSMIGHVTAGCWVIGGSLYTIAKDYFKKS